MFAGYVNPQAVLFRENCTTLGDFTDKVWIWLVGGGYYPVGW